MIGQRSRKTATSDVLSLNHYYWGNYFDQDIIHLVEFENISAI